MSERTFSEPLVQTRFTFHGKSYTKIAKSMAEDENRNGNIFQPQALVEPIGPGGAQTGRPGTDPPAKAP